MSLLLYSKISDDRCVFHLKNSLPIYMFQSSRFSSWSALPPYSRTRCMFWFIPPCGAGLGLGSCSARVPWLPLVACPSAEHGDLCFVFNCAPSPSGCPVFLWDACAPTLIDRFLPAPPCFRFRTTGRGGRVSPRLSLVSYVCSVCRLVLPPKLHIALRRACFEAAAQCNFLSGDLGSCYYIVVLSVCPGICGSCCSSCFLPVWVSLSPFGALSSVFTLLDAFSRPLL